MNIYIGNLHFKMNEDELNQLFGQYGEISSAKIIMDKITGKSKGFGFVEMPNDDEASQALTNLNGKEVHGRPLKVTEAREREAGEFAPRRSFDREGSQDRFKKPFSNDRRPSAGGFNKQRSY
jgi:RNA recognition motif-containing protein